MERKFEIGHRIFDKEGSCGTIIDITDTHYICDTMCVPISLQDEYNKFDDPKTLADEIVSSDEDVEYESKEIDQCVREIKEQVLENAIDFILETQKDNDYICEENGEWCATHCIDTLRKGCIIHYLKEVYKKINSSEK